MNVFKYLVALTILAICVAAALMVVSFMNVLNLGLLQVLVVGISMATVVVLCALSVWQGLKVYRED